MKGNVDIDKSLYGTGKERRAKLGDIAIGGGSDRAMWFTVFRYLTKGSGSNSRQ